MEFDYQSPSYFVLIVKIVYGADAKWPRTPVVNRATCMFSFQFLWSFFRYYHDHIASVAFAVYATEVFIASYQ